MTINLPESSERFIAEQMRSGGFKSPEEVITTALRLLDQEKQTQQPAAKKPLTEAEFDQYLVNIGLMSQIPNTEADFDDPDDQPIDIEGEPLSETVIRERR